MANSSTIQILDDGPIRTVVKLEGVLDTSDLTYSATTAGQFIDPAALASVDPTGSNVLKATRLRIDKVIHNIEDLLSVNFFWDATTPVRIEELTGRGKADYRDFGSLQNNAGTWSSSTGLFTGNAGFTGKIAISTEGWTSGIKSYSVILYLTKQY